MPSRRTVLQATASAAAFGLLAGCSQSESSPSSSTTGTTMADTTTTETDSTSQTAKTTVSVDALTSRTKTIVEQLAAGEYAAVVDEYEFTPAVSRQLDGDALESAWTGQTASLGQFVAVATVEHATARGYHVTDAVAGFTDGRQVVRITYDDAGAIAGLRFLESGGSYSPPDYVDKSAFVERDRSVPATEACSLPAKLSMPEGDGSVPGVVLVHGSGPSDMDESIGPNEPFRDLAWGLASRGVAVFRYEKRTAACDVDLTSLTLDEKITNDALAALSVLREHERVRAGDTVVVGHSIGGMVTPRIASRDDSLAGAAMLAANARPLAALYPDQYQYLVSLDGTVTDAEQDRLESVRTAVERVRSLEIDEGKVILGLGGRPFWRSVQRYDQVAVAKRLDLPLFVLQGDRDYQVSSEQDFQRWKDALSGQKDVRFQSYPDLNHLFMSGSGKPSPTEYFRSNNVAKTVVEDLATWVDSVTGD